MVRGTLNGRPCIAYFRVSTAKQGASGLGLEAQREAVSRLVECQGGKLVQAFTEVESGKRQDRPELAKALEAAKLCRGVLVIAKLDRLARNVAFISNLMESGTEFLCCDMPAVNKLTLHVLAAVAEEETRAISARTKAALQAAKARGVTLGGDRGGVLRNRETTDRWRANSVAKRAAAADARAADVGKAVAKLREEGATSLRAIAARLNDRHIPAPRGGAWTASQVRAAMLRAGIPTTA